MNNIRIDNIECRKSTYQSHEYEMVKWYKNDYYGNEEKMINEDGYVRQVYKDGDWGLSKDFHTINSSCFKNPESCYVIATLEVNKREPDINMRTVGGRVLDLEQDELDVFMRVYRLAYNMVMETINEDEEVDESKLGMSDYMKRGGVTLI